jgi:hypothetical protein
VLAAVGAAQMAACFLYPEVRAASLGESGVGSRESEVRNGGTAGRLVGATPASPASSAGVAPGSREQDSI